MNFLQYRTLWTHGQRLQIIENAFSATRVDAKVDFDSAEIQNSNFLREMLLKPFCEIYYWKLINIFAGLHWRRT
jgi:hypothetical protein